MTVRRAPGGEVVGQDDEWAAVFGPGGAGANIPLGTARWLAPEAAAGRFRYPGSLFASRAWIGEGFDRQRSALGYSDDRHVCLVSGTRGGKGTGVIIPNLCFWPGSCIVVDPKGENAAVTARRRGNGSEYAHGIGQKVCILDPFGEVNLPPELKARYNPLDAIDPESDYAIDDAARVAAALIVVQSKNDPYWELAARNLLKGLILHVLSAPYLRGRRNLVTVRQLLTQGDRITVENSRKAGDNGDPTSAFEVLWLMMRDNPAFNGVVSGVGEQMLSMAEKQQSGVIESARTSTEFLDSLPMQRLLTESDFDLRGLKTNRRGVTIYLTLPQRFMETHYRWLRLMIVLAVGEMERTKGVPATGHPTLFVLDEFAGLQRMEVIENAAAQAAGFGVKFLFVVQNLAQLAEIYEKSWETFLGNSGLKLFFQLDDNFSRSYVSQQLGEMETFRRTRSGSQSYSTSDTVTAGGGTSYNDGNSTSRRPLLGLRTSVQDSEGYSKSWSSSRSRGSSTSTSEGWGEAVHKRPLLNPDEINLLLARIDPEERHRPGYPGLVLALIPGQHPLLAHRVNYFESPRFLGYFDPHPDPRYVRPPTLAELAARARQAASLPSPPRPRRRLAKPLILTGVVLTLMAGSLAYLSRNDNPETIAPRDIDSGAGKPVPRKTDIPGDTGTPRKVGFEPPLAPAPQSPDIHPLYTKGVADFRAQKAWFDAQKGAYRAGAEWWAAHRSDPDHLPCERIAETFRGRDEDALDYVVGCMDAKHVLDPIDAYRPDPRYNAGFNDADTAASPATGTANGVRAATVSAINLNLRTGPGPDFPSVATLPEGTRVRIVGDARGGWQELNVPRGSGEILHGYSNGKFLAPEP